MLSGRKPDPKTPDRWDMVGQKRSAPPIRYTELGSGHTRVQFDLEKWRNLQHKWSSENNEIPKI